SDIVQLKKFEVRTNVVNDGLVSEIDDVGFLAIGTTFQAPHDGEAFTLPGSFLEVISQVEKTLQKPGLRIEPLGCKNRVSDRVSCYHGSAGSGEAEQNLATCQHASSSRADKIG